MSNLFEPIWEHEASDLRGTRLAAAAGARDLGATIYELDPGAVVSPLHLHHANEEMLIVLSGEATVRRLGGETAHRAGEVVSFPVGAEGAHQIRNRSAVRTRVLMVSTMRLPEVAEHLDSDKVLAITGRLDDAGTPLLAFRRGDAVHPRAGEPDG